MCGAALFLSPPAGERAVVLFHRAAILLRHRRARAQRGPARLRAAELSRERELEILQPFDHRVLQPLDGARIVERRGATSFELAQRRDRLVEIARIDALRSELAPERLGVRLFAPEGRGDLTRFAPARRPVPVGRSTPPRIRPATDAAV